MTPMVVQCSSCLTEFELEPSKVPAGGVRARCSVCSAVIDVPAPPVAAHENRASAQATPAQATHEQATHEQAAPAQVAHEPEPVAPEPTTHAAPAEPVAAEPPSPPSPSPVAPVAATTASTTAASVMESAWSLPKPSVTPAISSMETDAAQRRPINPFLTRDPALRAKRLARALVSDIVAYHPARHAEGLRDGTLKTLFRDEIKKSYEEYVDQVGRDFAGSTTHFQDALNDVLASGKKLF
ncbi:MAG TPA: zinc-ribbon domain-containing protein [Gemmatimonadaceae bacterium]|nr:zinc-ribbon domain-containing protein [Gemmatimonadaceae bacterium]